jgi:predicted RNA-binding Zn ribbon-like protein
MEDLDLCGGDPALDFVNTLGGVREGPWDDEWLLDYRHLVSWAGHAGLLDGQEEARLLERADIEPGRCDSAHADALALREAMYRTFAAHALREQPPAEDLTALAAAYREGLAHARLESRRGGSDWAWPADEDPRMPLWLVAHAAVELLRSERIGRLSHCRHCRWLFLDASKNRSRRWCSMAHCGTGAKVQRARARRQRNAARRDG